MGLGAKWGAGFDSPENRVKYVTAEEIDYWLKLLDQHISNEPWLWANEHRLFEILQAAVFKSHFYHRGANLLCEAVPILLLGQESARWRDLLMDALLDALSHRNNELLVNLFVGIGQSYLVRGRPHEARTALYNAFSRLTGTDQRDKTLLAYIVMLRAETYEYTDQFDAALVKRILALAHAEHDILLNALLFQALCGAYLHGGESEQALGFGMTALGYWYKLRQRREIVKTLLMLTATYRSDVLIENAQQVMQYVHRYAEDAAGTQYEALIAYEQGVLYYYEAKYDDSAKWLLRALSTFRTDTESRQIAMTRHMLGLDYMQRAEYEAAQTELLKAQRIWNELKNTFEQANILCDLGELAWKREYPQSACEKWMQALEMCRLLPMTNARKRLEDYINALLKGRDY
jgi:tetratricopeptide (TPR) repeat protein